MKAVQNRKIVVLRSPIDINGNPQGGNYSFVSMKNYQHAVFHFIFGNVAGNANITLQQAKNVSGNGAKTLGFTEIYRTKTDASPEYNADRAEKVAVASDTHAVLAASDDNTHFEIEMKNDNLDVDNKFDCVRPHLSDPAAAALVCIFVELRNPRFAGDPSNVNVMPSALVN